MISGLPSQPESNHLSWQAVTDANFCIDAGRSFGNLAGMVADDQQHARWVKLAGRERVSASGGRILGVTDNHESQNLAAGCSAF